MAISTIRGVKRPKVVEEPEDSDSDDDQSEHDFEVEIKKEEEEEDYLGSSGLMGDSFTAYPNDGDSMEIKEEDLEEVDIKEEEIDECEQGDISADKTKSEEKKTKKVKFATPELDSSDSDFSEQGSEAEEDNFGDDDSDEEEGEGGEGKKKAGSGLANVMAKILGTKKSEDVILSKAKTDREVKKSMKRGREETFEVVDSSGQVKKEPMVEKIKEEEEEDRKPDISLHDRELHRKLWEEKFRKRPNIAEDKEKERRLRVLATQGVVQLFSAIEKHRNMMQVKLSQCRSIMGREKVLEGTGKEAFLDILKQQGKKVKAKTEPMLKKMKKEKNSDSVKEEVKEEPLDLQPPERKKPKWNVLSDNFYKEPTLHGWDQESDDGED